MPNYILFLDKLKGDRNVMAYKTIRKINFMLNYLFRKKHFLSKSLRRLLRNALIQPHRIACTAWYPNLCKKLKNKIQTTQNKWVRFYLNLDNMAHISQNELEKLNWLPMSDRINHCILFRPLSNLSMTLVQITWMKCFNWLLKAIEP